MPEMKLLTKWASRRMVDMPSWWSLIKKDATLLGVMGAAAFVILYLFAEWLAATCGGAC